MIEFAVPAARLREVSADGRFLDPRGERPCRGVLPVPLEGRSPLVEHGMVERLWFLGPDLMAGGVLYSRHIAQDLARGSLWVALDARSARSDTYRVPDGTWVLNAWTVTGAYLTDTPAWNLSQPFFPPGTI